MSHVKLFDLTLDGDEFTRHGQHLNLKGKEKVARTIGQNLDNMLKIRTPILSWKLTTLAECNRQN
jgi:hypothetical protein